MALNRTNNVDVSAKTACFRDFIENLKEILLLFSDPFSKETIDEMKSINDIIKIQDPVIGTGYTPLDLFTFLSHEPPYNIRIKNGFGDILFEIQGSDTFYSDRYIVLKGSMPNFTSENRKPWTYYYVGIVDCYDQFISIEDDMIY